MRQDLVRALEILRRPEQGSIEKALVRLRETIFAFSMKVCGNHEDALDNMQETLLKVIPYLHRFERPEALAVWLYKVAKTNCLMSRRKSKYAPVAQVSLDELTGGRASSRGLAAKDECTPERQLLRRERRRLLQEAVLKLPPTYRLPLVLHDMEGLPTRQAADVLGIREGTMRVRLHRARLFLRYELARTFAWSAERSRSATPPSQRCRELIAASSDILDERLDDALCDQMERHRGGCEPCRAFLATLQRVVEECRRYRPAGGPPRLTPRAREILLEKYRAAMTSLGRAKG